MSVSTHVLLQANAEQAVRELLTGFSQEQGLKEVDTVSAEEYMDDGTPIRLAVTIDRRDGSALLDFEGMLCMLCFFALVHFAALSGCCTTLNIRENPALPDLEGICACCCGCCAVLCYAVLCCAALRCAARQSFSACAHQQLR